MDTTVRVQDMFSFSKIPIIVLGIIVLAYIVFMVLGIVLRLANANKKATKGAKPVEVVRKKKPVDIVKLKNKYLSMLMNIENQFTAGQLNVRESYQKMSETIRLFVFDVTGIKVQNCSLSDISRLNMPELTILMEEYYTPEFAQKSEGDVLLSLNKTKKAIEKWN